MVLSFEWYKICGVCWLWCFFLTVIYISFPSVSISTMYAAAGSGRGEISERALRTCRAAVQASLFKNSVWSLAGIRGPSTLCKLCFQQNTSKFYGLGSQVTSLRFQVADLFIFLSSQYMNLGFLEYRDLGSWFRNKMWRVRARGQEHSADTLLIRRVMKFTFKSRQYEGSPKLWH
jgi:hypothetical protein